MKIYKSAFALTIAVYASVCIANAEACPILKDPIQPKNNNTLYEKNIVITTNLRDMSAGFIKS